MERVRLITDLLKHTTIFFLKEKKGVRRPVIVAADLKNIILINKSKPTKSSLKIVQSLPHVSISSENNCFKPFWNIRHLCNQHKL
jgi:hypothetical protein